MVKSCMALVVVGIRVDLYHSPLVEEDQRLVVRNVETFDERVYPQRSLAI